MDQWEYLAIVGVTRDQGWLVADSPRWLHHITEDGVMVERIEGFNPKEFGKTLVRLGSLGWEMVSCANLDAKHRVNYFKRRRTG